MLKEVALEIERPSAPHREYIHGIASMGVTYEEMADRIIRDSRTSRDAIDALIDMKKMLYNRELYFDANGLSQSDPGVYERQVASEYNEISEESRGKVTKQRIMRYIATSIGRQAIMLYTNIDKIPDGSNVVLGF